MAAQEERERPGIDPAGENPAAAPSGGGSPPGGGRSPRRVLAASVALALVLLAFGVAGYHRAGLMPDLVLDDSYIAFRYARNLVRGHGLVYNVGERVEGYTSFLWTVAVAGAMAAGADPEPATEALAALAAAATILLLAGVARSRIQGPLAGPARFLPPVLFAAVGSQARYVVSGMETLLFGFLVVAGFAALFRRRPVPEGSPGRSAAGVTGLAALGAGALFGLAALTRPEGALYAGLGALLALWEGPGEVAPGRRRLLRRLRPAALLGGAFLAFVGPHLAWRWAYYGYPLPNTYYAKVSGALSDRLAAGWGSLEQAVAGWGVWPLLALALLALPAGLKERFWMGCYGFALATAASFVLVGGDFLPFFGPRLLMPALPFVLLLAAEGLRRSAVALSGLARQRRAGPVLVGAAVLALGFHALRDTWPERGGDLRGIALAHRSWRLTGEWLARRAPSDALIATSAAGIIPYVSDRPALDMFGLTDEHIAHRAEVDPARLPGHGKSDPGYVLDRRPDYLHVVNLSSEGLPRTARLGWVAGRIAEEYELVAQVRSRRGRRADGRWIVETARFRPGLYRQGFRSGIFRRIQAPATQARACRDFRSGTSRSARPLAALP